MQFVTFFQNTSMSRICILLISCFAVLGLQAQSHYFGLNLKTYETKADFNRHVNAMPMGFSLTYLKSTTTPLSFGAEVGVAMYNVDEYTVDINGQSTTIQEEDCFFTFHAFARYTLAENGWQRLYAEARLGATMFFSSSMAMEYESEYDDKFDVHGTAFNSGLGFGSMINPATLWDHENTGSPFWINLGVAFMRGSETEYRMAPSEPGLTTFEDGRHRSLTHYVDYRIGAVWEF